MGTYWNEDWLAYSVNQDFIIVSGKYPNYNKDSAKSLEQRLSRQLSFTPQFISVNPNKRIVVLAGDQSLTSFDIETKDSYDTTLDTAATSINWLDNYLLWQNTNNTVYTRDFDGSNYRAIVENANNSLPVVISENNKWLYYFSITESETASTSANSPSDEEPSENIKSEIRYTLKRKNIQ
jgi:hypothetical protein